MDRWNYAKLYSCQWMKQVNKWYASTLQDAYKRISTCSTFRTTGKYGANGIPRAFHSARLGQPVYNANGRLIPYSRKRALSIFLCRVRFSEFEHPEHACLLGVDRIPSSLAKVSIDAFWGKVWKVVTPAREAIKWHFLSWGNLTCPRLIERTSKGIK